MNVNINIPGLSSSSEMGMRILYLNNIIIQWQNIGFTDSHNYASSTNNLLGQMVAFLLNDLESPDAKTLYDININDIETKKTSAFEEWELSIKDIYTAPPPFNV